MSNAMSLKAKIRNIARQKNIPAQVILQNIEESGQLRSIWDKYRAQFAYAKDILFEQIMEVLRELLA